MRLFLKRNKMGFCQRMHKKNIDPKWCLSKCEKRNEMVVDMLSNKVKVCWRANYFAYKEEVKDMQRAIQLYQPLSDKDIKFVPS